MERTWGIFHTFQGPINGQNIQFKQVVIEHPVGVEDLVRENWDKQLAAKQAQLVEQGIHRLAVQPYQEDRSSIPLNALYEAGSVKIWPGPAIILVGIREDFPRVELEVDQTYYPFKTALNDPEIRHLYISQGIKIPRPSLAICTFAKTNDGKLTLTVRGQMTNTYPGRFHGQGGDPLFPTDNVVEHQVSEISDEILVTLESYNPRRMEFGGLVEDLETMPGKPDLVGWVQVNLDSEEIERRVKNRINYPSDAMAVAFAPASDEALLEYLISADPRDYSPSSFAGLTLYGRMHFGELWQQDLSKQLPD